MEQHPEYTFRWAELTEILNKRVDEMAFRNDSTLVSIWIPPLTGNRSRINKPVTSSRMNPLRRKFLACQAAVKSELLSFFVYNVEQARVKELYHSCGLC